MSWHGQPDEDAFELPEPAYSLLAYAYAYASKFETDGKVPIHQLRARSAFRVGFRTLIRHGYLRQEGEEMWIRDYLLCGNSTRDQIEEKRAKGRERTSRWRKQQKRDTSRAASRAASQGVHKRVKNAPAPAPAKTPTESPPLPPRGGGDEDEGFRLPPGLCDCILKRVQKHRPKVRSISEKAKTKIRQRLRDDHHTAEDLLLAIDGNFMDPWCCGENPSRKEYHDLTTIFRDTQQVTRFVEIATQEAPAGPETPQQMADRWDLTPQEAKFAVQRLEGDSYEDEREEEALRIFVARARAAGMLPQNGQVPHE